MGECPGKTSLRGGDAQWQSTKKPIDGMGLSTYLRRLRIGGSPLVQPKMLARLLNMRLVGVYTIADGGMTMGAAAVWHTAAWAAAWAACASAWEALAGGTVVGLAAVSPMWSIGAVARSPTVPSRISSSCRRCVA